MQKRSFGIHVILATLVIVLVIHLPALDVGSMTLNGALRALLSALLTGAVLVFLLWFSRWKGMAALVGTWAFFWGIAHFNTLNEAVFFQIDMGPISPVMLLAGSAVAAAVVSAALVVLTGRWSSAADPGPMLISEYTPAGWTVRVLGVALVYVVCYFIAGMIIFPYVQHFYAGRPIPSPGEVVSMQLFRGSVYALILSLGLRMIAVPRMAAILFSGAALSIIGGVSALLPDNPLLPADVRAVHMAEIGISNFVFGALAARVLMGPSRS